MSTETAARPAVWTTRTGAALRWPARVAALALVLVLVGLLGHNVLVSRTAPAGRPVPQSAAMEDALGVRFSRVAVVGDGGLVTLSYVVLDAEKASAFQSDVTHPPLLRSESRTGSTQRVSLMRQGHALRAGQTYYLVYQDTRGALRSGDAVSIVKGSLTLAHVPVL